MVGILEETMTSYIHSEFNWPLAVFTYEMFCGNRLPNWWVELKLKCHQWVWFVLSHFDKKIHNFEAFLLAFSSIDPLNKQFLLFIGVLNENFKFLNTFLGNCNRSAIFKSRDPITNSVGICHRQKIVHSERISNSGKELTVLTCVMIMQECSYYQRGDIEMA